MPNAGIHKWRSTSWNSGEPGLNDAQMASVTANAATEMMSVIHRISDVRRPSALPMSETSSAPTVGSSHEIESNGTFNQSPQAGSFLDPADLPISTSNTRGSAPHR